MIVEDVIQCVKSANYLSYIFIFLAGLCNGIMDLLQFHFKKSRFSQHNRYKQQFWNPSKSWRNKWKDGCKIYGEAFWGSSRWMVGFTDAWHLMKWIMIKCLFAAYLVHSELNWLDLPGLFMWYGGFWVSYESRLFKNH